MPEVQALTALPWGLAAQAQAVTALPWGVAARVQAFGSAYTPPAPPPGGTEVTPGNLVAATALGAATRYRQVHSMSVVDLRTDTALHVDALRIGLDDGSALWTLSASARDPAVFDTLTTGEQPASVRVTIDGLEWCFVVETVQRPRSHGKRTVAFGGRSVAAAADKPYQFEQRYIADAPTTAAQLVSGALLSAGVTLEWKLADWLIPAGALSLVGTPMDVARAVAAAVGATVTAHRSEPTVTIESRYPQLPNEWAYAVPDVQVHSHAVRDDNFERADQPAYTGVFVAGQQAGALAYVRLDGTSGADQAPLVTDPLLTDVDALRERGRAVLGAGGKQARVTRSLPVRVGAGEPGVLARGALARWLDQTGAGGIAIWHGMVRAVSVEAALPVVRQSVTVERHTAWTPNPDDSPALVFEGPIPDQEATVDEAYTFDLTPYRSGGLSPYVWSMRTGALPAGLAIVGESIAGTPTLAGVSALSLRVTDAVSRMQDSNAFEVDVPAGLDVFMRLDFDDAFVGEMTLDHSLYRHVVERYTPSTSAEAPGAGVHVSAAKFGAMGWRCHREAGMSTYANADFSGEADAHRIWGVKDFEIEFHLAVGSLPGSTSYMPRVEVIFDAVGTIMRIQTRQSQLAVSFYTGVGLGPYIGVSLPAVIGSATTAATLTRLLSPTGVIVDSSFHHVALVKTGGALHLTYDGVVVAKVNLTLCDLSPRVSIIEIGSGASGVPPAYDYIDDLRICVGAISRTTFPFAPPTSALRLEA
jgi:hypothetical protein